jgi:capsular polysaccharide biosynthesis protein
MREEIIILNILKGLKKRLYLIISITVLSVLTVWILLQYVITPDYRATTQIMAEGLVDETPVGDAAEDLPDPMIIEAYGDILTSIDVLEAVIIELELDMKYSVSGLNEMIAVTHASNPQVLNISVTSTNRSEAVEIANTLTVIFQEELMEELYTDDVTILTEASEEGTLSSLNENAVFDLGLAGAFGMIVGTLIAFILEMLSTLFKNNKRGRRRKKEVKLQTVFK